MNFIFHFIYGTYMGCHPSHWRTHIFQRGRYTTNQCVLVYWWKSLNTQISWPKVRARSVLPKNMLLLVTPNVDLSRIFCGCDLLSSVFIG
jgi:hypothetical protein